MNITKKYSIPFSIPLMALIIVVAVAGVQIYTAYAVTTRNLSTQVDGKRYRVTYADIQAAPMVDGDPSVRKLTLFTLAPGQQMLSFVTKVTTGFAMPGEANVNINAIRAEQNGVEVSRGDLAFTSELTYPIFENRLGNNNQEYAIYSEDVSTNIVLTIVSNNTLNNLTAGSVDFLVTILK